MTHTSFADLTVREFLDRLGSDSPTPGGGTGAAVVGAMGASLVRMLAALTVGKPKYAQHDALMKAIAEGAGETAQRLLALADQDARAYDAVSAAYKMPKATEAEQAARKAAIQAALKGAIEPPLKVMEQCLETIGYAKNAVPAGNRNAVSDGAAGSEFARAAMTVASYNVRINLVGVEDEAYAKAIRTRLDEMLHMGSGAAAEIDSKVQEQWKRPPPAPPPPFAAGGPAPRR
jgi:glutamate formiminotransferase/formiminotetrahydrofolate cyclodeaminase